MKKIPLEEIDQAFKFIELQNGKKAELYDCIVTKIPELGEEDRIVYKYNIPCPVCDTQNRGFSYDGKFFNNIQITCNYCGIYYRGVVKR